MNDKDFIAHLKRYENPSLFHYAIKDGNTTFWLVSVSEMSFVSFMLWEVYIHEQEHKGAIYSYENIRPANGEAYHCTFKDYPFLAGYVAPAKWLPRKLLVFARKLSAERKRLSE